VAAKTATPPPSVHRLW